MQIVDSYRNKNAVRAYPELVAMVAKGLEHECDYLGSIAGELCALNSQQGQFFTPYHISQMMAEMMDPETVIQEKGYITLQEHPPERGEWYLP